MEDAYLFGSDRLIAPITRFGVRSREVYLPAGTDWTNVWTGEKFTSGTQFVVDAPIEHISVFARSGKEALLQGVIFAKRPNQKWVSDFTNIDTSEGCRDEWIATYNHTHIKEDRK